MSVKSFVLFVDHEVYDRTSSFKPRGYAIGVSGLVKKALENGHSIDDITVYEKVDVEITADIETVVSDVLVERKK